MDFSLLKSFTAVADEKSFSTAAKHLFISQQSLSKQIAKLEEELGTTLFVRSRPLSLTPDGKQFLQTAKEILQLKQQYEESSSHSFSGALFVNAKLNRLNRSVDTNVEKPVNGATVSDDFSANVEGLEVRSGGGELPDGDLFSDKNIVNILLLGTDMKIPGTNDPGRCDCTMICSLNKATGEVKLIGFERAIGVPIPGYEDELLTYAYQYGAGPFMVETIEKCFNVDLAGYVHVGFETFPQVINAIGGLDVELDQSEIYNLSVTYQYSPDLHEMSPGMNHLEGEVAYGYCRLRDSDDDWARQGRTREAVQAMVNKLKTMSITDLNKLMDDVLPLIETDLTNSQLTSLMMSAPKFVNATVTQLMEPDREKTWSYQTGRGAFMIGCDFKECAAEIREFIYGK